MVSESVSFKFWIYSFGYWSRSLYVLSLARFVLISLQLGRCTVYLTVVSSGRRAAFCCFVVVGRDEVFLCFFRKAG